MYISSLIPAVGATVIGIEWLVARFLVRRYKEANTKMVNWFSVVALIAGIFFLVAGAGLSALYILLIVTTR